MISRILSTALCIEVLCNKLHGNASLQMISIFYDSILYYLTIIFYVHMFYICSVQYYRTTHLTIFPHNISYAISKQLFGYMCTLYNIHFLGKVLLFHQFYWDVCLFAITISTINLSINFNLSRVQKKIETIYIIML